jgi:hypothetical protein
MGPLRNWLPDFSNGSYYKQQRYLWACGKELGDRKPNNPDLSSSGKEEPPDTPKPIVSKDHTVSEAKGSLTKADTPKSNSPYPSIVSATPTLFYVP